VGFKEAAKQAAIFEKQCKDGIALDNRQTFAVYAEYVIGLKLRAGMKPRTGEIYRSAKERIQPAIGHMKIADIRPQHLNQLYEQLAQPGLRAETEMISAKVDLKEILHEKGFTVIGFAEESGVDQARLYCLCNGKSIRADAAEKIAAALQMSQNALFHFTSDDTPLRASTIHGYHRFISTVLAVAEKEMLIPYNPARKASPPKIDPYEPNYFHPEDIDRILEALEEEPIRLRTLIHLFLITGCRRGEIVGLRWEKVDWENSRIHIDRSIYYSVSLGVYEDTPKTKSSVRYIKLPEETMTLFREYWRWQTELRLSMGDKWQNSGYVFTNEVGGAMAPGLVYEWMAAFSKRHNLPHINPHAFRHTQASVLFFNGVDAVSISKRLGHSKISTTTDIYSHFVKQAEDKVSDCIANVILHSGRDKRVESM
jgi:integrase